MVAALLAGSIVACGGASEEVAEGAETATDGGTGQDDAGTEAGPSEGGEEGEGGEGGEEGGSKDCGDGKIGPGESCDGDLLGGQSCQSLGFVGGTLECGDSCTYDATGCTNQVCGNGIIEGTEECEGNDLGGVNCPELGFGPGLPTCTDSCTFDTSTCPTLNEGDPCSAFNPCENDLNCVSNTCYDGSPGDPCKMDGQCESGQCEGAGLLTDGECL
ncbi:hypothetical protein DB30_02359 [Enhygromyxa salina]|uniref:Uncharacterized protein n=1 Tax=Enhygromyxa salina TaxID=215803 RepID=A0A0C2D3Z1_9BACT|nr:hypothetical protein DB30_02359 [Enhygromyxa salina]